MFAPSPVSDRTADLRAKLKSLQSKGRADRAASLGDPRVDHLLPGGGLTLGCWHEIAGAGVETEVAAATAAFCARLAGLAAQGGEVVWAARRADLRLPIGWPGEAYEFDSPLSFMGNDGGGAVGTGPGHTIGAALALKGSGRLTIGVIGDGDYLMGVNALWTAAHFNIPCMIVVADNRSYFNDELHQERVAVMRHRPPQNRWIGQQIDNPTVDLVAMARAQGFASEAPVTTSDGLMKALKKGAAIVAKGGRYFIDSRVQPGYADAGPDQRASLGKK